MRVSIFIMLLLSFSAIMAQDDYKTQIENQRAQKDSDLQSRKTSPLQRKDRKGFQDLPYYEVDEKWKLQVAMRIMEGTDIIEIPTSAGFSKKFEVYGELEISIDGEYFPLMAYKRVLREGEEPSDHPTLFIPFKDLTTGEETYGGGRYLDIPMPEDASQVEIDFNLAYSPYCAYGGGFACPIPPSQNFIKAYVRAGEKALFDH